MQLSTHVKYVTHSCRYKGWLPQFTCDTASPRAIILAKRFLLISHTSGITLPLVVQAILEVNSCNQV